MATLVCFHAHPDDEAIATGGLMARAAAEGHRVVLVLATGGEYGETPTDLSSGETLADRRASETSKSAAVLGIARVEFLGYRDSGMTGWEQNAHPEAFMNAPIEEAAARLAAILTEENASTLTVYDWHGGYGHPDHIGVHRVGHRAAAMAATPHVYESTMNRDELVAMIEAAKASGSEDFGSDDFDVNSADDGNAFGTPEAELTTRVDVRSYIDQKRESLMCHASQVTDGSFFLQMPPEAFTAAFGTEWFIRVGLPGGVVEEYLAGLDA